jgi:molecular chaperone DnaK (HSP70)
MRWFKLLLMGDDLPKEVRESPQIVATTKLLRQLNKEAVDVTADYLKRLWEFAIVEIRQQNPRSIDGMPFRIVIGVPANWPQKAQDKMRIAAKRAGLLDTRKGGLETELEFVAEPEAAAVAAFHEGNIRYNICVGCNLIHIKDQC